MSSATKNQSSSSKPPAVSLSHQNTNPNSTTSNIIALSQEDTILSRTTHITRHELLLRRSHHLNQLSKCYRDHYWALMEELKVQYKDYYWKYGVSPFKDERKQFEENSVERENGDNNGNNFAEGGDENIGNKNNYRWCLFVGCELKAMALTSFCHLHILSDSKQKLYKPCDYVIKSSVAGPITCGKPILKSTVPSLCTVHFQKAQKHVTRALKKAGLNVSSSSKLAPKFHVIVADYIRQIQTKRRKALQKSTSKVTVKEESVR